MDVLLSHLPEALMVAGMLSLIIEVAVLGFSTFILLFLGISLLFVGMTMSLGWLPATWVAALWSNALLTAVLALALWKPLRAMQNKTGSKHIHNDFAEQTFVLNAPVDINGHTMHRYSGVEWKLKSEQPISAGAHVAVIKTEVGVMWVAEVGSPQQPS